MGYLTTFMVYNDAYSDIEKHPKDFTRNVLKQMNNTSGSKEYSIGSHANGMKGMETRHMSDTTLYMLSGNTLVDVFEANSEWAIDTFIQEMEYHLKRLKKIQKNGIGEQV